MKYKLLRFSLLSVLVMLCGGMAMAEDKTDVLTNAGIGISGTTYTAWEDKSFTSDAVYAGQTAGGNEAIQLRSNSSNSGIVTTKSGGKVKSVKIEWNSNTADERTVDIYGKNTAYSAATDLYNSTNQGTKIGSATKSDGDKTITITGEYEYIGIRSKSGAMYIDKITIVWEAGAADTRTATSVTISDPVQEGTVGESLPYPEVFVINETTGAAISGATVVWESSDPTVASIDRDRGFITLLAAGTTTISATYEGDDTYKGSEASYKLNVYDAPLTSLKELQEKATSTSTPVNIKFTDVKVVYVNGSNAFLADNDGYGIMVYTKDHGLEAGQVLNGTISANLTMYQGNAEITGFSKEGLTITTSTVAPIMTTIAAVTTANQSTLVSLKGVTYNATDKTFADGENTIAFFDKFKAEPTLVDGGKYDVTGIVVLFAAKDATTATIEIAPRTADDIAEMVDPLYIIGALSKGYWDMTAMDEVPYNATNKAYELEFATEEAIYFAFATQKMETEDWETFNTEYRLAIGNAESTGNQAVVFGEPLALSHGDKTIMITTPGEYKFSVSKDMSSVTFTRTTVPTYTSVIIAGNDASILGTVWDPENTDNQMEKQDDGTFKKVYENVEITNTSFEYKLVIDGEWLAGDNLTYEFKEPGAYNVTFTFDPATDKIECKAEVFGAEADPYEYTFENAVFKTGLVQELNGVQWTFDTEDKTANLDNYNKEKGQQFGTSKAPLSSFSLSTSGIAGTVKKVVINTSGAASINATVKVTVGDAIFTCDGAGTATLTDAATEYVFEGSSSGDIIISYTNNSAKAIYIKSIQVNPADAPETYDITLAKDMISFSCGKDLDFSEVEGLTAYIVVGGTANTAKLQEVAQVPAGEGAILQGKAGETYQVPVINIAEMPAFNFLYPTWSSDNSSTTVAAKSTYVLSDGTFKLFTGTEIESGKAYLNKDEVGSKTWLAGGEDATAAARTLDIEGDATGIDSVTREALSNGKIYNLQGQEVKNAQKGLFIVNGKKVLVP